MLRSDTAATGLALLAFQGAGYHHRSTKYGQRVKAAIDFLVQNQQENGDLYVPMDESSDAVCGLYSHSIAALALCEAYGMTQDPELKEPAQRALQFVMDSQEKSLGGWRYKPGSGADTSVSGWMMMALKSGQLATLKVPQDTFDRIEKWLDAAQGSDRQPHLYRYNPYAPDTNSQRHGRMPSKTMTAVGLLMRLYSGSLGTDRPISDGADYLLTNPPAIGTSRNPMRDTYYWYYATQVMFHMGGERWDAWYQRLYPILIDSQLESGPLAGSWDPKNPIPDRWAPHGGRLYVTTMNLLSLEVHYRILPLYEDTAPR